MPFCELQGTRAQAQASSPGSLWLVCSFQFHRAGFGSFALTFASSPVARLLQLSKINNNIKTSGGAGKDGRARKSEALLIFAFPSPPLPPCIFSHSHQPLLTLLAGFHAFRSVLAHYSPRKTCGGGSTQVISLSMLWLKKKHKHLI